MADALPTTKYYQNLGGINTKAGLYEMSTAQFLDLRNFDFDVPKALSKRPGSTFAMGSSNGTSGPISSLFEFTRLTGQSYVVAGSDTAMFYIAGGGLTLLSPGWTNGQPTDMLTFVNKLWMSNGQKWQYWDGTSVFPAGLPTPVLWQGWSGSAAIISPLFFPNDKSVAGTFWLVSGATMLTKEPPFQGFSSLLRGIYVAYSYVRNDGYFGPVDLQNQAFNVIRGAVGNNGQDWFNQGTFYTFLGGFTVPSGRGISAIAIWFAEDTIQKSPSSTDRANIPGFGSVQVGALGFADGQGQNFMSVTLKPNADLSRFWLYTTVPAASLFPVTFSEGGPTYTYYASTFIGAFLNGSSWAPFEVTAPAPYNFSAMTSDFFATFIPKYQEVNLNTMFISGFSSSPSSVRFSEVGEPESYLPDSEFEVRTNDGDRVFGLKSYNNQVIVMKDHSFHKIIGDNADNYQLVQISDQYGCLSKHTIVTYEQKCLWLDKKGILEFNGANFSIISGAIEGLFRRMNLTTAREKSTAVHHIYRNQIWWGIPVDGATLNNITVVYDYLIGGFTFFDGYNPSSYAFVQGALARPVAWRGDYSGMIHYTGESFFSDSGQGITCLAFTRFENVGGENQTTLWRRFFADVIPRSGATGLIQGQVFSNYNTSSIQATFSGYQSTYQTRVEMGVQGKAVAAQISHFSASLPLVINGYAWANRPLRNV